MNKSKLSQLISTHILFTENMSNPKPEFPTVIKTSITSITKHPMNTITSQIPYPKTSPKKPSQYTFFKLIIFTYLLISIYIYKYISSLHIFDT